MRVLMGVTFLVALFRVLLSACTGRMKTDVANVVQGLFDKCCYILGW